MVRNGAVWFKTETLFAFLLLCVRAFEFDVEVVVTFQLTADCRIRER